MSNPTNPIVRFFTNLFTSRTAPSASLSETVDAQRGSHWDDLPFYAVGPAEAAYVARIKSAHPGATIAWSRSEIGGLQADVLDFGRYACSRWSGAVASDAQYMD